MTGRVISPHNVKPAPKKFGPLATMGREKFAKLLEMSVDELAPPVVDEVLALHLQERHLDAANVQAMGLLSEQVVLQNATLYEHATQALREQLDQLSCE